MLNQEVKDVKNSKKFLVFLLAFALLFSTQQLEALATINKPSTNETLHKSRTTYPNRPPIPVNSDKEEQTVILIVEENMQETIKQKSLLPTLA